MRGVDSIHAAHSYDSERTDDEKLPADEDNGGVWMGDYCTRLKIEVQASRLLSACYQFDRGLAWLESFPQNRLQVLIAPEFSWFFAHDLTSRPVQYSCNVGAVAVNPNSTWPTKPMCHHLPFYLIRLLSSGSAKRLVR